MPGLYTNLIRIVTSVDSKNLILCRYVLFSVNSNVVCNLQIDKEQPDPWKWDKVTNHKTEVKEELKVSKHNKAHTG